MKNQWAYYHKYFTHFSEHPAHPFDTGNQDVDFFFGIVQTERGAHRTLHSHTLPHRLGAMVSRTYSNAQAVEQSTHVEMVNVTYQEGDNATLLLGLA